MKITGFETIVIELPGRSSYTWRSLQVPIGRYVILKVTTDEGVTGLGEAPCILSWGGGHGKHFGEVSDGASQLSTHRADRAGSIRTLRTLRDTSARSFPRE